MRQKGQVLIFALIGILVIAAVSGAYYFRQNPPLRFPGPDVIPVFPPSPSSSQPDQIELIKIACAKTVKQSLNITINPEDIILKPYEKSNKYAGKFSNGSYGEKGAAGGGFYLAAYANGQWVCPVVGNGTVNCSDIDPYNFPTDLIDRCVDSNNNFVYRPNPTP